MRTAYADYDRAKVLLELATKNRDRLRNLVKIQAISVKELQQAETDFVTAEAEFQRAEARLNQIGAAAETANKSRVLTISSPISGSVIDLAVAPGAFWNDPNSALMTVADLTTVWVTANVPEKDIALVAKDQRVDVNFTAYPGEIFHGRVLFISQVLDPDTRRAKVRIAFPNPESRLKPAMFANVTFLRIAADRVGRADRCACLEERQQSGFRRDRLRGPSSRGWSRQVSSRTIKSSSRKASKSATASSSRAGCFSMIDWIVGFALRKRLVMMAAAIFIAMYGYYSWTQLALEAYPDIADVTSQVITQAPGLAAEEVEQQITIPLERELNGTPGLVVIRSKSTFGLSLITLVFRDGAEDYWSRQRILERIQNVTLPPGITSSLDPLTSPVGEIYRYTLESDTKGLRDLSEIQRWIVVPAFKQVPGVADVTTFGGITTQFQLELDPAALTRFNISLKNVTDAIKANSANSGGSMMTRGELGYVIRSIGVVQTLDDLGNIVVTQRNGTPIFVRDLGHIEAEQPGASRHPRQGRKERHCRRHHAPASRREPFARHRRHPREG